LPNAFKELIKSKDYDRFVGVDLDRYGRVWLATLLSGILIYDPETQQLDPIFSDQDLQRKVGEVNLKIYCDREGVVWTSNWQSFGIYEILPVDRSIKRYAANPGVQDSLSDGFVISIVQGPQNKMWIGTLAGLNIFDPVTEKFEVFREKDLPGIQGQGITPAYVDTVRQKAWLFAGPGIDRGDHFSFYTLSKMYEMDIKTRQCRQIRFRDGTKLIDKISIDPTQVRAYKNNILICLDQVGVFEIKDGSLFADLVAPLSIDQSYNGMVLTDEGQMFVKPYAVLPNFSFENRNGNWVKTPHILDNEDWWFIIHNEKDHTYWISFKNKLVHYDKNFSEIKTYGEKEGYTGVAFKMVLDNKGDLWFTNILGQVGRLNVTTGIITMLSETDGYDKKNYDWAVPLSKDIYGNIYFGTGLSKGSEGLDRIYPEKYFSLSTSSAYLQSITINQKRFQLSTGINNLRELSLRYNQNTIAIETGIIDFFTKGKNNFRYKLIRNGKDEQWQYVTTYYNTIRYDGLVPGKYKLVMQASNAGSEFNSPEKILMINISPPFWETWWFRTLAIVFLLASFYGIYRWRTATLRRQKRKLEQTVKERTAEVVEEKAEVERQKAKSDELLLNILPFEVAEELKEKGYTTAKSFDEVTILFSDIKGFTHVAEKLTAQQLVKEIDTYFSAFDNIMQHYGLEKIKTIGDAYIAAGGLPEDNTATVQNVVEAAIAMQRSVEDLKNKRVEDNLPYFELRIGIHTGPVVAGVVGIKKFQYDIWGDTVNLAARMEQSGVPGKINISQYTYEKIKDQFHCEHRGKIDAKNKGEIDMYFVIS
jgi:class 3 adenylate cyclase